MTVVLHVIEQLERHGGTPRKLLYLVKHGDAGRQRHEFVTFVPGNLDAEMRSAGANVLCAGSPDITAVTRCLFQAARRLRADVVCTHFTRALVCGVAVARLLRLPVIHNAHGPAIEKPAAGLAGRVGRVASRWSYPETRLVIANSRFTASTLQSVFAVPASKLRVIPNPVVLRERSEPGTTAALPPRVHGRLRLVQVGGLIPVRRQHLLLEGLAGLLRSGVDAELLMVGDGPLKNPLVERARHHGVDSRVHWLGYRDDIGDVLAASDMYVSAIDTEGFGIAVVEAMLHGLPVVLANGGAHPELVYDGRFGVLFDPMDAGDLARKVAALWSYIPARIGLAEAARAHAAQSFAPQRYAQRYQDLVTEVLAS